MPQAEGTKPMSGLSTLQDLQNSLIRKTLNYSIFVADSTADAIDKTTLFDAVTGAIKTLPAGYKDLGFITDDGAKYSRSVTKTDVTSLQSVAPTRSDVTADDTTLQVDCQETKLATIGIYTGADFSAITPDVNGAVQIDQPAVASNRNYRVFGISEDITDNGSIYICRFMPAGNVESYSDQSFSKAAANLWGVTFKGLVDSTVGTAHRWIFGGEGWLALLAEMGLSDAS